MSAALMIAMPCCCSLALARLVAPFKSIEPAPAGSVILYWLIGKFSVSETVNSEDSATACPGCKLVDRLVSSGPRASALKWIEV